MAVTFLEPGGDADFSIATTNGFWKGFGAAANATVVSDFVHGTHQRSLKYPSGATTSVSTTSITGAGSRISMYIYIVALPTSANGFLFLAHTSLGLDVDVFSVRVTSGGVLQMWSGNGGTPAQIGTNGTTLSTGQWYRISLAYTITSTSVNRFELFVNGVSSISITNATLFNTTPVNLVIGHSIDTTFDVRSSDHYVDNLTSLTDTGNIWVTAKRPVSNGTTNNFTTQIGSGGSGYGTGHSPQVNERPLSTTNGWSIVAVGATTEEYNIEGKSAGDIDISAATIIDYTGWVSAKSLISETASIIVNNVSSNISLTSTITLFIKVAGSATYPAGTGTDIGMITSATATTVSLYECGVIVAFIPSAVVATSNGGFFANFI